VTEFRRGQVDWALWQWFVAGKTAPKEPPSAFLTRIKRLLEIDRLGEQPKGTHHALLPRYAFYDAPPEGMGSDTEYSAFRVFCLAIGLDLLDAGFSQLEVAFLLRHITGDLEPQYKRALKYPPVPRIHIPHEDMPELSYFIRRGIKYADPRIFMLVNKIDVSKQFSQSFKGPSILKPQFYWGLIALNEELQSLDYNNRRAFILEIGHTAVQITKLLSEAPVAKRGRPPQKTRRRFPQ
jgi:hypothetical protein